MFQTYQLRDFPSLLPLILANLSNKVHSPLQCPKALRQLWAEAGQNRNALVTDEKTEVQRDKVTCPRSHSRLGVEAGPGTLIL